MNLKHIRRTDHCLNCQTPLDQEKDNFCPSCGQVNNVKKETAIGLVRELVEEFLHLDSKVMRSLVPLLFKPGYLTVDYNNGRRARYFHPVRMFLTLTVVFFIISGLTDKTSPSAKKEPQDATAVLDSLAEDFKNADSTLVYDTEEGFVKEPLRPDSGQKVGFSWAFGEVTVDPDSLQSYLDKGITDPDALMDTFKIHKDFFNKFVFTQVVKKQQGGFKRIGDYYKSKLPWLLFSLMPVFAFVLYLFYIRKKIFFVDHLICAFHLHSAVFVLLSIVSLLDLFIPFDIGWLLLYVPAYYFLTLKNVYKQSWMKTLVKGFGIGFFYFGFGFVSILIISAILFLFI